MGAAVVWGYVDLFGTESIRKLVFVDEPISIVAHADWSERELQDAGGIAPSPEPLIAALNQAPPANPSANDPSLLARLALRDSPYFTHSEAFANSIAKKYPNFLKLVMYFYLNNDWRDVVNCRIDRPTAIFTGEFSANVSRHLWTASVIRMIRCTNTAMQSRVITS